MKFAISSTLFTAILSSYTFAQGSTPSAIATALSKDNIIPDVLPAGFVPEIELNVSWVGRSMEYGTEYFPYNNETNALPVINFAADANAYYTLSLVDPDAPSRADPFRAQVRHYLSVNIKGSDIASGNSTSTPYLAPRPFAGCGRKRFVWVLARQPSILPELSITTARPGFSIAKFVSENNMKLIAANYFEVESSPANICTVPNAAPTPKTIAAALSKDGVISDVLPADFVPEIELNVSYVNRTMSYGTEYFPYINETDSLPVISYAADANAYYTLSLVDPDAPSRANPFRAQVRHYLSVNIKGSDLASGNSTSTPYLAPRPFAGCGRKRFVWVLARQPSILPELS
ncbi:OV-16 antigen, partial [Smittium culicis]